VNEIAQELGVASVLAGSVSKAGDKIRINVQLIDGDTDLYLWSESYDRNLDDVFAIQSDVAQQVASALNAQLQPEVIQRIDQIPTDNMEAYDLYLKALNQIAYVGGNINLRKKWLQQAIELDSNFSTAYSLLGNTIIFEAGFIGNKNTADVAEEGKAMLETALLLNPMDGIAHVTMAQYYLWYEKDFNKAEIELLTAMKLAPSDQSAYIAYIDLLLATDRFEEAIPVGSTLLEVSNNNSSHWARMALIWAFNNQRERMIECIERANASPPVNVLTITEIARSYLVLKQYEPIPDALNSYVGVLSVPRSMGLLAIAYNKMGNTERYETELGSLIQRSKKSAGGSPLFYLAMVYASKGETDMAFQWLEKSFVDNEIELYWLKVEPEFASLYDDPRWQEMLDKVGFPE